MTPTLRRAGQRRWLLLVVGIVPVTLGVLNGTASVGPRLAALLLIGALAVHFGLSFLAGRARGGTALILASVLLDISIATAPLALTGDRTLSALLLLAVVPYAFDQDRVHPALLVLAGWLSMGAGAGLYAWGTAAELPYTTEFAVSAYVFLAVAGALCGIGAGLRRRIGATQARLAGAAAGSGNGRAVIDDLGRLDRDLTVVLQRVEDVASGVRRDVGQMATLGGQLAAAVEELQAHTEIMATASNDLSRDLVAQRALGAEAREKGDQAAAETEAQRIRADQLHDETSRLVSTAGRARERVARTSETLLSVGAEVRDTAAIVVELKGMSARIAKFAQTIARIGRQTHLLALNAAIEAARSDAAGQGFAVVAEEVRALAAQAGKSARDVAELVGDLQAGIDAAAKAMASGGAQVAGIDAAAREADHALRELEEGVQRTAERALQTAGDGREQTARLNELARILTRLAEQTHTAAATAATGAASAAGQLRAMGELGATAQRLVELTDLLRSTAPTGRSERQG